MNFPSSTRQSTVNAAAEAWNGSPYFSIGRYYKSKFGEKVYKIPVSVAETCPNRQRLDGMKTCIFCDAWGSAAYPSRRNLPLEEQIRINRKIIQKRYKAQKFLVYFQAYTNTFDRVTHLKSRMETALDQPDVIGAVVGTRPDCLPSRIFPMLRKFGERAYIAVELGAQSFQDRQLAFLRRGHAADKTLDAVRKLDEHTGVDIGLHLMFGLPGETTEQLEETAEIINSLPAQNVKLHNLHVLENTPLAELYRAGRFTPIELEEYAERVIAFLLRLSPEIAVQRLTAVARSWDELVAPSWAKDKMRPTQFIVDRMNERRIFQGMNAN